MEEKKKRLLEQLERMKEQAKRDVDDGHPLYFMHARCALEFAELAIELLEHITENVAEELTRYAEKLKAHYPHTPAVCKMIDCELEAMLETLQGKDDASRGEVKTSNPPIQCVLDALGTHEEIKTKALVLAYDDDGIPGLANAYCGADLFQLFNVYMALRQMIEEFDEKHPGFASVYNDIKEDGFCVKVRKETEV